MRNAIQVAALNTFGGGEIVGLKAHGVPSRSSSVRRAWKPYSKIRLAIHRFAM